MDHFSYEILDFLKSSGFYCESELFYGIEGFSVRSSTGCIRRILLLETSATNQQDAHQLARLATECIENLVQEDNGYPLIISEDRWHTQGEMTRARILAHLEVFNPIYARNCEVRRIDRNLAKEFLEANHSYGYATCKYCYGLFFKRHTGHIAQRFSRQDSVLPQDDVNKKDEQTWQSAGALVAVATFSNARKWTKGDKTIRSYEWTRYASLPDVRLSGGMGRMLKTFIKEVHPDDIMSYADLEWSAGEVYAQLGFELEGVKDPVMFSIDSGTWKRTPIKPDTSSEEPAKGTSKYFQNLGSNKYRLKLTDYK